MKINGQVVSIWEGVVGRVYMTTLTVNQANAPALSTTTARTWIGRVLSGLFILFMIMDCGIKLIEHAAAIEGTTHLGFPATTVFPIGLIGLACLALYVIPRTAILGAVLWTAYLGGAIVTHLRVSNPLFSHTLFPIYVAVVLWLGLYLRDGRLQQIVRIAFAPPSARRSALT